MSVPVDDLANNTDALLQRVQQGETVVVTDNGEPIAQLVPAPRRPLTREEFLANHAKLPRVDADKWRRDVAEAMGW